MTTMLRVANWAKYQHYKKRNPPWVKLYRKLLENPDLMRLQDASKWLAVCLLIVASKYDNQLPDDPAWLARTTHTQGEFDIEDLISVGFLERYESPVLLASRKQRASTIQRDRETEKQIKKRDIHTSSDDELAFDAMWKTYPKREGSNSRAAAWKAFCARRKEGVAVDTLRDGLSRYAAYVSAGGVSQRRFVMQGSTFFGPDRRWEESYEIDRDPLRGSGEKPDAEPSEYSSAFTDMLEAS